ncbi:uncharacterized protein AAES06_005293 isoform 2-T2 [Glossophaga mutica]
MKYAFKEEMQQFFRNSMSIQESTGEKDALAGWNEMLQVRFELLTSTLLAHLLPCKYCALTDCATGALAPLPVTHYSAHAGTSGVGAGALVPVSPPSRSSGAASPGRRCAGSSRGPHRPLLLQSAPFCMKCGITRPYRIVILTCAFAGSALLWWAFSLPTWVKIEIPGTSQALFSALFAICSGEVKCWVPPSKPNYFIFGRIFMIGALVLSFFLNIILLAFPHSLPDTRKQYFVFTVTFFIIGVCVFLSLLLHSLHILKVTDVFKEAKITFLYPSFLLSFSITLFFLSGILCFFSSHHCWLQCVLPQPIQVKPRQTASATGSPVTVTERKPGGDSQPNLSGEEANSRNARPAYNPRLHSCTPSVSDYRVRLGSVGLFLTTICRRMRVPGTWVFAREKA